MAFWDKVKGVANDAMNTLSDAAKDVTESAKEMNEKSKINRAIKVEEGKINNLYMVMGEKRKGIKVTYVTDTRPLPIIAEQAKDADLFYM